LGLKEEALDLLERVFGRGWGKRDWVERDPDYDPLRADPRFQRLLAKLSWPRPAFPGTRPLGARASRRG
jgi:hypothetical protein